MGELTLPLDGCNIGWASQGSVGELTLVLWVQESWQTDSSDTTLTQGQGSELVHLNIYSLCIYH